jgi:hypothetical protein
MNEGEGGDGSWRAGEGRGLEGGWGGCLIYGMLNLTEASDVKAWEHARVWG